MSYSVVDIETGTEIARVARLPARVHVDGVLRADYDAIGQLAYNASGTPVYKLVERIQIPQPSPYHRPGTASSVYDGARVIVDPGWTVDPERAREDIISRIKDKAYTDIIAIAPEWKQRNLTAQATLLLRKGEANWTPAEQAAWVAGEAVWIQIASIRAASDTDEQAVREIGDDGDALVAWADENLG